MGCCLVPADNELVVMTWNVQNLFDAVSQGSEYPEFDPESGTWNTFLYHLKLAATAEVIKSPESGNPDVLLLQEVENAGVVQDLLNTYLKGSGYEFTDISGEDYGAVHTAILSRYPLENIQSHAVWGSGLSEQRFIMEYRLKVNGRNVIIFNDHWKSKAGSDPGTEERLAAAAVLEAASLNALEESSLVVAGGDFNCEYDTFSMSGLSWEKPENCEGSYVYKREWEAIDMLLLSENMRKKLKDMMYYPGDLMKNSLGFPVPFNAYSGQGYSDHLPLIAVFAVE